MVGEVFPSVPIVANALPIDRSLLTSEPSNAAPGALRSSKISNFLTVDCTMWRLGYDAGDEPTIFLSPLEERNDER